MGVETEYAFVAFAKDGAVGRDFLYFNHNHNRALRAGDWKLIPALGSGGFSPPDKNAPVETDPLVKGQLYNLRTDPSEQRNLWKERPEVVERMVKLLEECKSKGRTR